MLRKSRNVKADDLLPLELTHSFVKTSKSGPSSARSLKTEAKNSESKVENNKVSLKDIDFGLDKGSEKEPSDDEGEIKSESKNQSGEEDEDEDYLDTEKLKTKKEDDEELKRILDEENDELYSVLSKARKRIIVPLSIDIKTEEIEQGENKVDFDK